MAAADSAAPQACHGASGSPAGTVAVALAVFLVLVLKWRYVSLGSVAAAAVMPPAVYLFHGGRAMLLVTALVAVIVIIRHHANIKRLVDGTENKFKA